MTAEKYLKRNQASIAQKCEAIANNGSKAIITVKKDGENYVHQVSSTDEFTQSIPDNNFFKTMRDGINNAVLNKVIPIIIFEEQKARIISLPEYFEPKK